MTAVEIIREIESLSPEEKAKVLGFLMQSQGKGRTLSPDELVALADKMVAAADSDTADRLEAEILRGFYGR